MRTRCSKQRDPHPQLHHYSIVALAMESIPPWCQLISSITFPNSLGMLFVIVLSCPWILADSVHGLHFPTHLGVLAVIILSYLINSVPDTYPSTHGMGAVTFPVDMSAKVSNTLGTTLDYQQGNLTRHSPSSAAAQPTLRLQHSHPRLPHTRHSPPSAASHSVQPPLTASHSA